MASTNPHGFIACQEFNSLIDKIIGATKSPSIWQDAALLSVSKLPLIREVLNDMGYTEEAPLEIKGNNAFIIGFRLVKEVLGRVEVKLEDRDRASQFRIDLRKISSALDVFDSGFGPTSQLPSSSPESSYDRVSLAPSLSYTSDDSYCPGRSSSPSSSDTDHPTVSEKPVRSAPQGFAKLKIQYADYKPITKPILAVPNLRLKRRHSDEDGTATASRSTPTKKMRHKKIDTLSFASLLTSQPHTAWQDVDATTTQNAASSRDSVWSPRSFERYLVSRRRL